ncbi:NADPH-dependent FMN reductase [Asticcacaulis sp. 201]|uniref:NADPH-dependent FMN reductase n=1 Tax=Asticcacaulis sp. 201 TaxID=3028787 RepID=UPI002916898F|nr:NADPH-dependent FMN reductase [Asticcacaulis sp. 201]MDV6330767.1 NADPH-dependent FMN reductase [Asticcacaulis sp. 201]
MTTSSPFIVGFGGTTRAHSTSERLVGAVLTEAERAGARTRLFGADLLVSLPHYAPENPVRTPAQQAFVEAVRIADGIVIGTPAYHGGVSGLVKNAIDLTADLQSDTRVFLDGRPVGIVVAAGGWQGAGATLSAMRDIVHALRGWPTPMGVAATSSSIFDNEGQILDASLRSAVATQARQLVTFIQALTPA